MNEQLTVVAKLVKARREVGSLAADKHNPQGRYDYISADKILERVGDALMNNGVMIIPAITGSDNNEGQTSQGKKSYTCGVCFVMTVTDGESSYEVPWVGSGVDYGSPDKALYKAITSGHKYFLMKLFNIGVGNEDGEHENAPIEQQQTRQDARNGAQPSQAATQHRNGAQSATTQPTQANPFNDAKPAMPDVSKWAEAGDAYRWAMEIGACAAPQHAQNAMKKIVDEHFDGKLTRADFRRAMELFAHDRLEKLAHEAQKEAA